MTKCTADKKVQATPETGQGSRIDNAQDTEQAISNIEYQLTYNDAFHIHSLIIQQTFTRDPLDLPGT